MFPVQCRLKPLNLPKHLLDKYAIFPIYSSDLLLKKAHQEKVDLKEITPAGQYNLKREFSQRHKPFKQKTYLEIACGTGDFITAMASEHPKVNFVGVDHATAVIERAIIKVAKANLNNILFYIGKVEDFFEHDLKGELFDLIMINFPDPWPKKKHFKRRIVQPKLIKAISKSMKANGELITVTDIKELYEWHLEVISSQSDLINLQKVGTTPPIDSYSVMSNYEVKGRDLNRPINYTHHLKQILKSKAQKA